MSNISDFEVKAKESNYFYVNKPLQTLLKSQQFLGSHDVCVCTL